MVPKPAFGVLGVLSLALNAASGHNDGAERIQPSHEYAKDRAHMVFNAVHSAGRQWGSALYHNGFGFFPATVPEGAMFYHGARQNVTPSGPEWLAFDIEHAENFARSFRGRRRLPPPPGDKKPGKGKGPPGDQEFREELRRRSEHDMINEIDNESSDLDDNTPVNFRGYLHTYQANRELNILLIDGMSAGKTNMGTLDSQDILLRENKTKEDEMDEWHRALALCDIATEWGFDGFSRVEIGIEIIKCNFSSGLDLVSMTRTELYDNMIENAGLAIFQWIRAVGERYNGIAGDRLRIDFSSMVSGLFFPINISSTITGRPDLMRLGAATLDELKDIKAYLKDVLQQPRRFTVNWQGVADLVISRYSKRLALMAYESLPSHHFINEIEDATLVWVDAPPLPDDVSMTERETNRTADGIEQCKIHYLRPALLAKKRWSPEDELIYTSIDTVLGTLCQELFSIRSRLLQAAGLSLNDYKIKGDHEDNPDLNKAVEDGRIAVQGLMDTLGWSIWKQPQPCAPDEIPVIAMWPFGTKEDHWHPGCRSIDVVQNPSDSYWSIHIPRK
ncbi:hypothetical protein FSARC_412 [Fusarium sarcochroum]|uniref:Uncharacterized protein n=1 Tax=Fusarium sarcochroum TaxID=1208366 RepID=A0A8H4UBX8_9HYPO|nr:hypothetical protein FSARC_412 [Fusarium sarcochroum]